MMRIAVIDIGTNTFHLLVVERSASGRISHLYRDRQYVFLGEGGPGFIGPEAYRRGIQALEAFARRKELLSVDKVVAIGTSALRNASNSREFIEDVYRKTKIRIEVIDGQREAYYIYRGVEQTLVEKSTHDLIMDVGGGSVELIYTNEGKMLWASSYRIGISVLYELTKGEVRTKESRNQLLHFLEEQFSHRPIDTRGNAIERLIGASGTFEVIANLVEDQNILIGVANETFLGYYNEVLKLDLEARLRHPKIPTERAKYISVALFLVEYILKRLDRPKLFVSRYAMKEGIVLEV